MLCLGVKAADVLKEVVYVRFFVEWSLDQHDVKSDYIFWEIFTVIP